MHLVFLAVLAMGGGEQSREPPRRDPPAREQPRSSPPRAVYFANCTEARAAGRENIRRGEPGYRPPLDRDNDGIACEKR